VAALVTSLTPALVHAEKTLFGGSSTSQQEAMSESGLRPRGHEGVISSNLLGSPRISVVILESGDYL